MMIRRPKVLRKARGESLGRGFSPGELKKVGLSMSEAVRLHVGVDPRRKTVHEENVDAIRTFLEGRRTARKAKKPKRKSKS